MWLVGLTLPDGCYANATKLSIAAAEKYFLGIVHFDDSVVREIE